MTSEAFKPVQKYFDELMKHITIDDIAKTYPFDPDDCYGGVQEYSGENWHALYGNRELAIFVDDIEEPWLWCVDIYGDRKILVER